MKARLGHRAILLVRRSTFLEGMRIGIPIMKLKRLMQLKMRSKFLKETGENVDRIPPFAS